jgi:hypothetical protein
MNQLKGTLKHFNFGKRYCEKPNIPVNKTDIISGCLVSACGGYFLGMGITTFLMDNKLYTLTDFLPFWSNYCGYVDGIWPIH